MSRVEIDRARAANLRDRAATMQAVYRHRVEQLQKAVDDETHALVNLERLTGGAYLAEERDPQLGFRQKHEALSKANPAHVWPAAPVAIPTFNAWARAKSDDHILAGFGRLLANKDTPADLCRTALAALRSATATVARHRAAHDAAGQCVKVWTALAQRVTELEMKS